MCSKRPRISNASGVLSENVYRNARAAIRCDLKLTLLNCHGRSKTDIGVHCPRALELTGFLGVNPSYEGVHESAAAIRRATYTEKRRTLEVPDRVKSLMTTSIPSLSEGQLLPMSSNEFSTELFNNPPAQYRGAPFWAWNNKLDQAQLLGQIENFKLMGLGGFFMHSRTGLDTDYLGDEFMAAINACVDRAKQLGMYAYLYDEDRWPSGSAGGLVTENTEFRARHILFTPFAYGTINSVDREYMYPHRR